MGVAEDLASAAKTIRAENGDCDILVYQGRINRDGYERVSAKRACSSYPPGVSVSAKASPSPPHHGPSPGSGAPTSSNKSPAMSDGVRGVGESLQGGKSGL
jgi:hypothetical protein